MLAEKQLFNVFSTQVKYKQFLLHTGMWCHINYMEVCHILGPRISLSYILMYLLFALHINLDCFQLAEFGLSNVGLIDSTEDMPDTVVSGPALYEYGDLMSELKHLTWIRKRSAAGTPDYLAPELLLGTGCGKF